MTRGSRGFLLLRASSDRSGHTFCFCVLLRNTTSDAIIVRDCLSREEAIEPSSPRATERIRNKKRLGEWKRISISMIDYSIIERKRNGLSRESEKKKNGKAVASCPTNILKDNETSTEQSEMFQPQLRIPLAFGMVSTVIGILMFPNVLPLLDAIDLHSRDQ